MARKPGKRGNDMKILFAGAALLALTSGSASTGGRRRCARPGRPLARSQHRDLWRSLHCGWQRRAETDRSRPGDGCGAGAGPGRTDRGKTRGHFVAGGGQQPGSAGRHVSSRTRFRAAGCESPCAGEQFHPRACGRRNGRRQAFCGGAIRQGSRRVFVPKHRRVGRNARANRQDATAPHTACRVLRTYPRSC